MDSNAEVLRDVFAALRVGGPGSAKATLKSRYPFEPVEKIARRSDRATLTSRYPLEPVEKIARQYSVPKSMDLFMRDGFIDRYTGNRLINPGVLRLLHVVLGDDFPWHPNGKFSETHIAFWDLFPTVDHFLPVSRGGDDDKSNLVTASMLSNQAKAHWSVEDLGWELHPAGAVEEWDGLSRWLVEYLAAPSTVLEEAVEPHRGYIGRWLRVTRAALEGMANGGIPPLATIKDEAVEPTSRDQPEGN